MVEATLREGRRVGGGLRTARLTHMKTLESNDFSIQPSLDRHRVMALAQLEFINRAEVLHFLGPLGSRSSRSEAFPFRLKHLLKRDLVRRVIERRGLQPALITNPPRLGALIDPPMTQNESQDELTLVAPCQSAANRDPLSASKNDPLGAPG